VTVDLSYQYMMDRGYNVQMTFQDFSDTVFKRLCVIKFVCDLPTLIRIRNTGITRRPW